MIQVVKILLLLLLTVPAFAQKTTQLQKDLAYIYKYANTQKTYHFRLRQEFYSKLRNKTTQSQGTLFLAKPNKFRFEISQPRQELYIFNGKDFWKYIADMKFAQHLSNQLPQMNFLTILTDLRKLTDFYDVKPWKPSFKIKTNDIYLKLTPKEDQQTQSLFVTYDKKRHIVSTLQLNAKSGNTTRFIFDTATKTPVTPQTFDFKIPKGIILSK